MAIVLDVASPGAPYTCVDPVTPGPSLPGGEL